MLEKVQMMWYHSGYHCCLGKYKYEWKTGILLDCLPQGPFPAHSSQQESSYELHWKLDQDLNVLIQEEKNNWSQNDCFLIGKKKKPHF